MNLIGKVLATAALSGAVAACGDRAQLSTPAAGEDRAQVASADLLYGTDNSFASEAIYFLLTDRFVDGDPGNNQVEQGGPDFGTFNRELPGPNGQHANIGYLGGDFRGVLDNADYIAEMGFTCVWLTPIVDNPDAAFSGDKEVVFGAGYQDGLKTGYHGYWGVNFYKVDEHLVSEGLEFRTFVAELRDRHGLKFILDIVGNHGSPSYTMPESQPEFGKIYDEQGTLVADHQNLHPENLNPDESLHKFFNRSPGLAKLSDFNPDNPDVLEYLIGSYLKWLDQGVYAIRVDTIKEQPHYFWKQVADRIREHHPDIFMFGESYSYDAEFIAEHTRPENGGFSVLDFPGQERITAVFENPGSDFADILPYLHLESGVYENPYELVTFYDNHDMARMNADDNGFIDANNWLFTSRGIPAIYYGSEVNFMTGAPEHRGNRNYFGQERIEAAKSHPIRQALSVVANIRKNNVSLQKGVQLNVLFSGDVAAFYRIYQKDGQDQSALVMLNKGNAARTVEVERLVNSGVWKDAVTGDEIVIQRDEKTFSAEVPSHGIRVFVLNDALSEPELLRRARELMGNR